MFTRSIGVAPCVAVLTAAMLGAAVFAEAQDATPGGGKPDGGKTVEWKVGALVPDVTLEGSDGKKHRLRDLTGKRAFVVAWYPKSFTGG